MPCYGAGHPRLPHSLGAGSRLRRAALQPSSGAVRNVRCRMREVRTGPGSPHSPENGGLRIMVFEHEFEPETL